METSEAGSGGGSDDRSDRLPHVCGTEPREGARFCDGCGAPVMEQETRAGYKQVTVLFADVVRSMSIAAAVGVERLREIMADLADRCAAVVQPRWPLHRWSRRKQTTDSEGQAIAR